MAELTTVLYEAMARYLRRQGLTVDEVTGFSEDVYVFNRGCSCGPTMDYKIYITYASPGYSLYTYEGKFGDLIRELTTD